VGSPGAEQEENTKRIPREYQENTKRIPREYEENTKTPPKHLASNWLASGLQIAFPTQSLPFRLVSAKEAILAFLARFLVRVQRQSCIVSPPSSKGWVREEVLITNCKISCEKHV
jgi:hypothetical protein